MGKSYIVIEGRGENGSVEHLLRRLSIDLGHPEVFWRVGGRTTNLKSAPARFSGDPEAVRSAKKEINRFLPRTHPYKETTHQIALTRLLDLAMLRASGLPCFGTLERAVAFLLERPRGVYPA